MTTSDILQVVSKRFGVTVAELRGARRHPGVSGPRAISMYLARALLGLSYPEIGQRFGGRHHTTVMSACARVREGRLPDHQLREVHGLHEHLRSRAAGGRA